MEARAFDVSFWMETLQKLGYPLREEKLDTETLKDAGVIPAHVSPVDVLRIYKDDYVEGIILQFSKLPPRSVCSQVARNWKSKRLIRPLLFFTDGRDSYAVIVPGKGTGGEVKILWLHERLYRTDIEVLESLRFPGKEKLKDAYDTSFFPYEKVRDEFFEGYRELYEKTVSVLKASMGERASSYAQRFLGRLMFLYFLQRKGWLKGDRKYVDRIKNVRDFNRLCYEELAKGEGGMPLLNGSLFEREEYFTPELEDKTEKKLEPIFLEAREFFNRYNFTVDESSPMEMEVCIDPLLLGTVLENLLSEKERKEKGTFYTPPSEIGFMCRKAIAACLGLKDKVVERNGRLELVDGLEEFLDELRREKSEKKVREFREKLLSLRVMDPAVGSGGFLVIMMQTLIQLIHEAEATVGWRGDPEEYKKRILPNLCGFDIEPEAVEIAKLRLWLSLVIDQREPEPLPNLDLNLMEIEDSLYPPSQSPKLDEFMETRLSELINEFRRLNAEYLREHTEERKKLLRKKMSELKRKISEKMGVREGLTIESLYPSKVDIVVMNPPYVRQEQIPEGKKNLYVGIYGLDRTSDLYAYFMLRALQLVRKGGVVAVISSDKWLESGYGRTLQRELLPHLRTVYGQRKRSFQADINTVITILQRETGEESVDFIYLDSYTGNTIRNYRSFRRSELKPGKWYYLRSPRIFEEVFLPRLTHKLKEFVRIKRGFTSGANEFFYMKDVSHLYEADRLANPQKFRDIPAKNRKELEEKGLIYIENGAGERFVIDRKDTKPLVRSPKEIRSFLIPSVKTLCLYTSDPGPFTKKYIKWGESQGFHKRPTCKARERWWELPEFEPAHILLPMFWRNLIYIPFSEDLVMCDNTLYALYCNRGIDPLTVWIYLNSTLFYLTVELYCRRLGGGGGAAEIKVEDYEELPVPDLSAIKIKFDPHKLMERKPLKYAEEIKQTDRKELDKAVIESLLSMPVSKPPSWFTVQTVFGTRPKLELDSLLNELHQAFLEVVEDRLIKAGKVLAT